MIKNVLQCCYTNASEDIGGKVTSGWKAVAYSPGIPAEAFSECKAIQNANSAIQGPMMDEQGSVLNLLEVCGDGSFFYVIRTQYGLLDRLGRANMFSHAYIFPCDQAVTDPNVILTIDKSNFSDSEEAANAPKENLLRTPAYSLNTAMEMAGLTPETYIKLVRSIYVRMNEQKKGEPLYIQYDGTEDQICALLYCIYKGLPFYLRKTLKSASSPANFPESRNIIFSVKATQHQYYVVPQTGENTVLSPRAERRVERYGYIDYAVRHYGHIDGEDFYRQLEGLAIEMGDPTASNETLLRLAYQVLERPNPEEYSDEDLENWLADALRVRARGSALERHIALMLKELRSRNKFLDKDAEEALASRLGSTTNSELFEAGEQYNIDRFATLPSEEAARRLEVMAEDNFARYSQTLAKSAQGLTILDLYFENKLRTGSVTWENISDVLARSSHMTERPLTTKVATDQCWLLYVKALEDKKEIKSDYERYIRTMVALTPGQETSKWVSSAKQAYWSSVSFENFDYSKREEYHFMRNGTSQCKKFLDLIATVEFLGSGRDTDFLERVQQYFSMHEGNVAIKEFEPAIGAFNRAVKKDYRGTDKDFARWVRVAARAKTLQSLKYAIKVREATLRQDVKGVMDAYEGLLESNGHNGLYVPFAREVNAILLDWCTTYDTPHPIPLDMWLLLSRSKYGNAFQIFDDVAPQVLKMDPDQIESRLLGKNSIRKEAEIYIRSKGTEAKTIKRWLASVKQEQREQEKVHRSQDKGRRGREKERQGQDRGLFGQDKGSRERDEEHTKESRDKDDRGKGPLSFLFKKK